MMKVIAIACMLPLAQLWAEEWIAPADASAVKNPVAASVASPGTTSAPRTRRVLAAARSRAISRTG